MQDLARSRGGKCLSSDYRNNKAHLIWECSEGHQWKAKPDNIKQGGWCPVCAGKAPLSIEEAKEIARRYGGECLSESFRTSRDKLQWRCKEGHEWHASLANIKHHNSWCPTCSEGLGERITREFFEQLFGYPFKRIRPKWLRGEKGLPLELDGYCSEINIAFEHHGKQHYEDNPYYHRENGSFEAGKRKDVLKRELCKLHGLTLIEVPEVPTITRVEDLKELIKTNLIQAGRERPADFDKKLIDLSGVYHPEKFRRLQEIAKQKGGMCLSSGYVTYNTLMGWRCQEGHIFKYPPSAILRGNWCKICSGTERVSIEEMRKIAALRGGSCLSEKMLNSKTDLEWQCDVGHTWKAKAGNVKRGSWCPVCARETYGNRKYDITTMNQLAATHAGTCLSAKYVNEKSELLWECDKGHQWYAKPISVRRGVWCKACGWKRKSTSKYSLENMKELAESKGGICISSKYGGYKVKLKWQCNNGHTWHASPDAVISGKWCRRCGAARAQDHKRLTIEEMDAIAQERGGRCLSSSYTNEATKLLWICKKGHIWEAIPRNIKHLKQWCPTCAGRRQTIQDMQELAINRGGECISERYLAPKVKLRWKCATGHEWDATPDSLKRGSWCPVCANKARKGDKKSEAVG